MTIHLAKPEHEAAYQDVCKLVNKYAGKLSGLEMLAVAANMVGKMIALQDQRTVTSEIALQTVANNIEVGNQQARKQLEDTKGNG